MRASTPRRVRAGSSAVRRRTAVFAAGVIALTTLAACQSTSKAAVDLPVKGGTLNVILSSGPIVNLDPQEISLATDANVSHLINRTLTTVNSNGTLVPDLATDLGRPDSTREVWDFTLKPNLKWQDGSPVTCQDVQYGIERRFAGIINAAGGLPYPTQYLVNKNDYTGPFLGQSLSSIVCIDSHNIEFHLVRPVGDFGYTVSVATFAPMKASQDQDHAPDGKSGNTDFAPFSDGPYEVDQAQTKVGSEVVRGQKQYFLTQVELKRNPYWNPATDSVRTAYPDQILIQYNAERVQVTNALIQSATPYYQDAISLDADVTPNYVQQVVNDPDLSKRAVSGFLGATRYFAINTKVMTDKDCRVALEWGFDKRSWRYAAGGSIFGQLATGLIPPNLKAYSNFDEYDTNSEPDGDYNKAKALWTHPTDCPKTVTAAYPDSTVNQELMETMVTAYARAGIAITPVPIDPEVYYQTIGDPHNGYDMELAGWVPDWANGSAVIPPLFNADEVNAAMTDPKENALGNFNYSQETDATMQASITQAYGTDNLTEQYHLWGQLDQYQMEQAYTIPILYSRGLRMEGTKVRGAVIAAGWGEPDLSQMGVVP